MTSCPGTAFSAKDVPRPKDLKKAFELADVDKSGVVSWNGHEIFFKKDIFKKEEEM